MRKDDSGRRSGYKVARHSVAPNVEDRNRGNALPSSVSDAAYSRIAAALEARKNKGLRATAQRRTAARTEAAAPSAPARVELETRRFASLEAVHAGGFRRIASGFYREASLPTAPSGVAKSAHSIWELRAAEDDGGGYELVRRKEERAVDLRSAAAAGAGTTAAVASGIIRQARNEKTIRRAQTAAYPNTGILAEVVMELTKKGLSTEVATQLVERYEEEVRGRLRPPASGYDLEQTVHELLQRYQQHDGIEASRQAQINWDEPDEGEESVMVPWPPEGVDLNALQYWWSGMGDIMYMLYSTRNSEVPLHEVERAIRQLESDLAKVPPSAWDEEAADPRNENEMGPLLETEALLEDLRAYVAQFKTSSSASSKDVDASSYPPGTGGAYPEMTDEEEQALWKHQDEELARRKKEDEKKYGPATHWTDYLDNKKPTPKSKKKSSATRSVRRASDEIDVGDLWNRGLRDLSDIDGPIGELAAAARKFQTAPRALFEAALAEISGHLNYGEGYEDHLVETLQDVYAEIKEMLDEASMKPEGSYSARRAQRSGYGGWPMVPSKAFPDEMTLSCGECGGTDIMLTTLPGGRGTGPGGKMRMGDPGNQDAAVCQDCGAVGYLKKGHKSAHARQAASPMFQVSLLQVPGGDVAQRKTMFSCEEMDLEGLERLAAELKFGPMEHAHDTWTDGEWELRIRGPKGQLIHGFESVGADEIGSAKGAALLDMIGAVLAAAAPDAEMPPAAPDEGGPVMDMAPALEAPGLPPAGPVAPSAAGLTVGARVLVVKQGQIADAVVMMVKPHLQALEVMFGGGQRSVVPTCDVITPEIEMGGDGMMDYGDDGMGAGGEDEIIEVVADDVGDGSDGNDPFAVDVEPASEVAPSSFESDDSQFGLM